MTIAMLALVGALNILMLLLWRRLRRARQRPEPPRRNDATDPPLFEADRATMALYSAARTRAARPVEPTRRSGP